MLDMLRTKPSGIVSLALLVALATAGCAGPTPPPLPVDARASARQDNVYRLGLGDKLRINVFGEAALSGEYQVSGAGSVAMPLIGDVAVTGKTARELEALLVQRYGAGYLRNPRIAVEVFGFRPYYITGEIQKPGGYPTTEGMTLISAIAAAGGFTYRANKKTVFIQRVGDPVERSVSANANIPILPGDVVRVGERHF
ncbi:polysaccharide biosynthesis/export family protein [Sphingomonas montana]|uniref:polysaccharide biosynthesis/export family protein n=1 Tax=Sphingomonas montana TaxID=1843236 RepID=UPI001F0B0C44|nr:polysaccharide biosynthesis/export family protein [Sphingomonas montana]